MRRHGATLGAAFVAAAVCIAAASAAGLAGSPGYRLVGTWGKPTSAHGIATDQAGNVYIADSDNSRVQVFTAKGSPLRTWGSPGTANDQFNDAEDVDVSRDGTVWVADQQNSRLQAFSSTGAFEASIPVPTGELPRGIAVDAAGDVIAAVEGSGYSGFRKYVKSGAAWAPSGDLLGSSKTYRADDIEVSPDGSIFTVTSDQHVRHFSADGTPLGAFALSSFTGGIGIDLDCNVWVPDFGQRRIAKYSPTGRLLTTLAVPDLIVNDIAVGPKGDVYGIFPNHGIIQFAENRAPAHAAVGSVTVSHGLAKLSYTLSGVACPAQIAATASLTGKGISGRASVTVAAGKATVLSIPVKAAKGSTTATFRIVLKTNARPTTQTATVTVHVS